MPNYGSRTPPSYLQGEIGPTKDRISLTGPRVCPREGDNRPELRLAAVTKVGFDCKNLQMHTLDKATSNKTLATTLLAVIFATFHNDYSTMTYKHDDTVQKRNS